MKLLVLDTNILLSDATSLTALASNGEITVLPETVLDELDSKKSGFEEINFQAREAARNISDATRLGKETVGDLKISKLELNSREIWIISKDVYEIDFDVVAPNILNDRKIIHIAEELATDYDVEFVTLDVMCRIRAESLGLTVTTFAKADSLTFEFTKTVDVSAERFGALHNSSIYLADQDYKPENFNYMFRCDELGQTKLGTITNEKIEIIGKESEKELRNQKVRPQNSGQLFLAKAIQDPTTQLVIAEAKAGTGKTLCAISNAIRLVELGKYQGIIYVRASVDDLPKEEQIGFLAGNAEKLEPYLHPLDDSLDFIARENSKSSKLKGEEYEQFIQEQVFKLKSKYNIRGMIGLGMRGRTFPGCILIIDEVQNQNETSLQKVLTRVGKDSKVILTGSNAQIDNPYVSKHTNGLAKILEATTTRQPIKVHAVKLPKIVRSSFAEWAENVFVKENK